MHVYNYGCTVYGDCLVKTLLWHLTKIVAKDYQIYANLMEIDLLNISHTIQTFLIRITLIIVLTLHACVHCKGFFVTLYIITISL